MPLRPLSGGLGNGYLYVAGQWYCPVDAPLTTGIPSEGQTRYLQFTPPANMTLDGIGIETTVAGDTTAVIKLIIKADNAGTPGTTLWASDALDATGAPGLISANPGLEVKRNQRRWLGVNVQGGATTRPTIRLLNVRHGPVLNGTGATACWAASGETASSFGTPSAVNTNPPAIVVKRS